MLPFEGGHVDAETRCCLGMRGVASPPPSVDVSLERVSLELVSPGGASFDPLSVAESEPLLSFPTDPPQATAPREVAISATKHARAKFMNALESKTHAFVT